MSVLFYITRCWSLRLYIKSNVDYNKTAKKLFDMQKTIITIGLIFVALMCYGQSFSKDELKRYSGQGNKQDRSRAAEIAQENPLNDMQELSLSCIQEYPGQTKQELYNKIYNWIVQMSSDSQSAFQVADSTKGIIQTRCYIRQIAKRTMGDNRYKVNIRPLLTFDFKEGKVRFTFTLQSYDVLKKSDSDEVIFFGGGVAFTDGGKDKDNQVWPLAECYPYAENPSHPKVTSSRALINSYAAYKILEDRMNNLLQKDQSKDDW